MSDETAKLIAGGAVGWQRVLTHPVAGSVLAVDRYQPNRDLKRTLTARDLHCRFPGCRQPANLSEIDHTQDWQHGGSTKLSNLAHLCKYHHMVKHHTEWGVTQLNDGVLEWRSPLGRKYLDRPPSEVMFTPIEQAAEERPLEEPPPGEAQPEEPPPF